MQGTRNFSPDVSLAAATILLVSREPSALPGLRSVGEWSWQLETVSCGLEALERVQSGLIPDMVVLDVLPGDSDSLHTLRWLRHSRPTTPVVVISTADGCRQVVEAALLEADHCLIKPYEPKDLEQSLRRHLRRKESVTGPEPASLASDIEILGDDFFYVAASRAMRVLRARADMLAQANGSLLIIGEYGSGIETTARLIHKLSVRSPFPFLKVNCAALPVDLLSRELFGYEVVSVRGQVETKPGKLELCDNGTLMLEDIDSMPDNLQAKLQAVLQKGRFTRLGGETPVRSDVRVLATLCPSGEGTTLGRAGHPEALEAFSEFVLHVPPLRERAEDIPLLIGNFMSRLARKYGLPARQISTRLLAECQTHPWPGNLRELEDFVKRYLILGDESLVHGETPNAAGPNVDLAGTAHASNEVPAPASGKKNGETSLKLLVRNAKGEAEKIAIAHALETTRWNRKAAARLLAISYRALLYKIQEYQMTPADESIVAIHHEDKVNGRHNL
jgi:DNA-binding NtrC family response regulator